MYIKISGDHYLIWIGAEVKVLQEAGGKLTEQEVVGLVDGPQTPVSVVVGAGAGAERTHCNTNTSVCEGGGASSSSSCQVFQSKIHFVNVLCSLMFLSHVMPLNKLLRTNQEVS